jgi:hypothetical protein
LDGRAEPGHDEEKQVVDARLRGHDGLKMGCCAVNKAWMAGSSPAMTG